MAGGGAVNHASSHSGSTAGRLSLVAEVPSLSILSLATRDALLAPNGVRRAARSRSVRRDLAFGIRGNRQTSERGIDLVIGWVDDEIGITERHVDLTVQKDARSVVVDDVIKGPAVDRLHS